MKYLLLVFISFGCVTSSKIETDSLSPSEIIPLAEYQTTIRQVGDNISDKAIYNHVSFLASDDLLGRDTQSSALEIAASYIRDQMLESELQPLGNDGTFFQRFPYVSTTLTKQSLAFNYITEAGQENPEWAKDFWVVPGQEVASEVEVVFGGYAGNPVEDLGWEGSGKIILYTTTGNPLQSEETLTALQTAVRARAAGIVLLLDETNTTDSILDLAAAVEGQGLVIPIPIVGLSNGESQKLLRLIGIPFPSSPEHSTPQSPIILPEVKMSLETPYEVSEHLPPNVVGLIPGNDPLLKDQYIIYSAHFDHVGVGLPDSSGDSIYNGADDNASGVAVLLETAAAFSRLPQNLARSIIFLAVSGEEKGLLGSQYFSENPTIPLEDIILNINLDMVGRNPQPDTVIGVGKQYTNLGELTDDILQEHPELGLTVIEDPVPEDRLFFRSDHLHFINKDIPAIFFTGGEHPDYHKPSDEVDKIHFDKTTRLAKMVFYLGARVATGAVSPKWKEEGLKEVRRIIGGN